MLYMDLVEWLPFINAFLTPGSKDIDCISRLDFINVGSQITLM